MEGVSFPCHYHEASEVRRLLGERYTVLEQRALSLFLPPPHIAQQATFLTPYRRIPVAERIRRKALVHAVLARHLRQPGPGVAVHACLRRMIR